MHPSTVCGTRPLLRCRGTNAAEGAAGKLATVKWTRHSTAVHRSRLLPPARVAETATRMEPPSIDSSMESSFELDELPTTSAVPAPQPATLFARSHIERWTPALVLYFPFGCALAALRFALWIGCIALDAPWFRDRTVIDAYLALLGFKVTWQGKEHIPSERHVLVSNHSTTGDLMILFQRPQRYTHLITTGLPKRVFASFNLPVFLLPACKDTYTALAQSDEAASRSSSTASSSSNSCDTAVHTLHGGSHTPDGSTHHSSNGTAAGVPAAHASTAVTTTATSSADASASASSSAAAAAAAASWPAGARDAPVHLFPEGGMTNGRGMLRFSRGFMRFAEGLPVVPVALRCRTTAPSVNSHTLTSSFLANLFWFSFPLFTEMTATALPPMCMQPGESKAAFVQRVQAAIAAELGVGVADMNVQQKRRMAAAASKKR